MKLGIQLNEVHDEFIMILKENLNLFFDIYIKNRGFYYWGIFFQGLFLHAYFHSCLSLVTIIMCLENQVLIKIVNPLQCWKMTNLKISYLHMLCFFLVVVLVTFALVGSFFSMIWLTPITIANLMLCTTNWLNRGYLTKISTSLV